MFEVVALQIEDKQGAYGAMAAVGTGILGQRQMADKLLFYTLVARGLSMPAAMILKQEALSKGCEAAVHRQAIVYGVERTDVVLGATLRQYRELCKRLRMQQFKLPVLADELEEVLRNLAVDRWTLQLPSGSLELGGRTKIMGILNVTPDSFSDGGSYDSVEKAVNHGIEMAQAGADILDIGGESTRPGYQPVEAAEEIDRVVPVIQRLRQAVAIPLSVDTQKAQVAAAAAQVGVDILNDISGLGDDQMAQVAAETGLPLVVMDCRPEDSLYPKGVTAEVTENLRRIMAKGMQAGMQAEQFIVDPGIGFGKNVEENYTLIRELHALQALGRPVLLGASRKRLVGAVLNKPPLARTWGDAAITTAGAAAGAAIIRVHAVAELVQTVQVADAIYRGRE